MHLEFPGELAAGGVADRELWLGRDPGHVRIGESVFETSLFPKDGGYVVPIKDVVRRAEGLVLGDTVVVELTVGT